MTFERLPPSSESTSIPPDSPPTRANFRFRRRASLALWPTPGLRRRTWTACSPRRCRCGWPTYLWPTIWTSTLSIWTTPAWAGLPSSFIWAMPSTPSLRGASTLPSSPIPPCLVREASPSAPAALLDWERHVCIPRPTALRSFTGSPPWASTQCWPSGTCTCTARPRSSWRR